MIHKIFRILRKELNQLDQKFSAEDKPFLLKYTIALSSIVYILYPKFYYTLLLWDVSPFLIFIPSIIISSWYGGLLPGLVATVFGIVIGDYYFLHPRYTFIISDNIDILRILLFTSTGILISLISQRFHNERIRVKRELNNLRLSEERFRLLIEGAKDYAIFLLNNNGCIISWNNPATNIYQFTNAEITGQHLSVFFPERDKNKISGTLTEVIQNGRFEKQVKQRRKDKTSFWADVHITPIYDIERKLEGFVCVVKDITQEKTIENQKSNFLNVVAHELKTPIAILRVIAYNLLDEYENMIENDVLIDLNKELESITILVEDLLDISKIERGKLSIRKTKVIINYCINDVINRLKTISQNRHIVFSYDKIIHIFADETRIKQVLINLLENAIKHSPVNSTITLTLQEEKNSVIVSVHDQGNGIAKKYQKNIFDIFYQVKEGMVKGFGLGLYISKEIVTLHGGKIWVASKKGAGSTFYFSLPIE